MHACYIYLDRFGKTLFLDFFPLFGTLRLPVTTNSGAVYIHICYTLAYVYARSTPSYSTAFDEFVTNVGTA